MAGEGAGGHFERAAIERPPLAGGETYIEPTKLGGPRISDDGWRPQPFWQAQMVLKPQLETAINGIGDLVVGRDARVVLEARLLPNYLSSSNWPSKLFDQIGAIPVGSRPDRAEYRTKTQTEPDRPTKRVLLSVDATSLHGMISILDGEDQKAFDKGLDDEISRFDDLVLSSPQTSLRMDGEVRSDADGNLLLEAVLHPQLDRDGEIDSERSRLVLDDWVALVEQNDGTTNADLTRSESGLTFVPLTLPATAVASVARFAQLRILRPLPPIKEPRPSGGPRFDFVVPDAVVLEGERIAVFDGGVDVNAPGLAGYVVDHDLTGGTPSLKTFVEHGTAVCSAALYGHLEAGKHPLTPHTGIDHYRVWPPAATERADADLMWVLKQIETVLARGEHRIAIISLGPAFTVADEEPHPWTAVLDQIAADYGVLIVVAAGNTGDLAADLDRLLVPADAVNGLSVGACGSRSGEVVRADYSSVGPGRAGGRTAPMGVQFGGDLSAEPFGALLSDGTVGDFEGTSLAAPVVARAAAELSLAIEQGASAALLRTMLVHFADRVPSSKSQEPGSTPSEVGYGRFPESFQGLLDHSPDQVTILFEGTLKRKEQVTVPFPLPQEVFAQEPTRLFGIRWTLGFLGPVEPANAVDYSCAGLGVFFRPDTDVFNLYPPDDPGGAATPVNRRTEPVRFARMINQGWTPSLRPKPASKKGYAPEVVRRAQDGRWETVVRMDRQMKGASLNDPCLDMHMLGREAGLLTDIPDLDWVLILTMQAPAGCSIYDETKAHATQLTPLVTTVPVISSAINV